MGGFGGQPNNNGAAGGIGGFAGGFAGGGAGGFAGGGAGGFGGQPNNGPGGGFVGGGGFGGGQIGVGGGFAGGFAGGGAGGFQGIPAAPQPRFVKGAVSVFHLAKFDKVVEWDRPAFGLTFANEDILATVEVADKETVVVFRDVRTGKIISKQSGCSGVTFLEDGEIMVSTDMTAEQPSLTVWTVDYKPRK
ncbi:MAG: hypothetical protein KatS3mg105_1867 [Gemmatales bacterium]|nr:MAG: hypothetical protein KatS3mg105_1867 [Gemmatales bacterium]